jgi:hypothetical protein
MYWIHGLLIESEIRLDTAITVEREPARAPDYRIVAGEARDVPYAPPKGRLLGQMRAEGFGYWAIEDPDDPRRWMLRYSGLCDVILDRRRRRIVIHSSPGADLEMIGILVEGSILAHAITAEGQLVLHASAVEVRGSVVAIAGQSGVGKSTLAALLCGAGARLVADDTLRVNATAGRVVCFPSGRCLRLRPKFASLADGIKEAEVRQTADGRLAVFPPLAVGTPLELHAVLFPTPAHEARELDVERLGGTARLVELLGSPRLSEWRAPDQVESLFELTATIAEPLTVMRATVPWGPPFPRGLAHGLLSAVGLES